MTTIETNQVYIEGVQPLPDILASFGQLPSGHEMIATTRATISEITPTHGSFAYLGCGQILRHSTRACKRVAAPSRRLDMDGLQTAANHDGPCDSRDNAMWYWKFGVLIRSGDRTIHADVWEAASQLLQVGDLPYSAALFSQQTPAQQVYTMRDRMRLISGTMFILDLIGRRPTNLQEQPHWLVWRITRPVIAPPAGLGSPLPDSPPHSSTGEEGTGSPLAPSHPVGFPGETLVCLSSDSEYLSPESPIQSGFGSGTCPPIDAVNSALGKMVIGDNGDATFFQAYVEHLQETIDKVERDIVVKELDLKESSSEYLEDLKKKYIQLECM